MKSEPRAYICTVCGQHHGDLPHVAFDMPLYAREIPEMERPARVFLTDDLCSVDSEHFFIRGVLEIPVHDYPEEFGFGVWVSQKEENYRAYADSGESNEIGPFFGWLSNEIAFYPERTLSLKARAHFRGNGLRPFIRLEPTDHPLAVDQRKGIALARAWEIVHYYIDLST